MIVAEGCAIEDPREALARDLVQFRGALLRDGMLAMIRTLGDADISLTQLAALFLLLEQAEPTIKQLAQALGRSVSATGRLLDQLVRRGMVSRREDARDRRVKRVAITAQGRAFIASMERHRVGAQLAVMRHLTPAEQAEVLRAMALLAEGARRRGGDGDAGARDRNDRGPD
jgi:DNA-binding MarR family transcriptional regulator